MRYKIVKVEKLPKLKPVNVIEYIESNVKKHDEARRTSDIYGINRYIMDFLSNGSSKATNKFEIKVDWESKVRIIKIKLKKCKEIEK